jgi:hypothetical protein
MFIQSSSIDLALIELFTGFSCLLMHAQARLEMACSRLPTQVKTAPAFSRKIDNAMHSQGFFLRNKIENAFQGIFLARKIENAFNEILRMLC